MQVANIVDLPEELPFDGVGMFGRKECTAKRYQSKIDAAKLIRNACAQLGAERTSEKKQEEFKLRREEFKVFLLAI